MKLTEFSLRNPILVIVMTLALVCFGLYSYLTMGVGVFPNVNFPGVTIITARARRGPGDGRDAGH